MFFYVSKIFWFFAQPLNFSILLVALTCGALVLSWRRMAMTTAACAFLLLGLGAWSSLGALMMHPLEDRFQRPAALPEKIDGIVVLGGGFEAGVNLVRGGYELNSSGDRFVEAAILAARHPEAKVVVTGGAGDLILDGEADGVTAPRLLTALGVAPERLILESKSRNTYENAVFTKEMANANPGCWSHPHSICHGLSGCFARRDSMSCRGRPITAHPARKPSASRRTIHWTPCRICQLRSGNGWVSLPTG
jgi:uncharacterized SAM-binding protein YcdF (DUF218 family)